MSIAIANTRRGEEEKLASALHQLKEEDPTVRVEVSAELGQTLLHCQGDMHLAVIKWKLQNIFKLDVQYNKPKVAYRETITRKAEATTGIKNNRVAQGSLVKWLLRIDPWYEGYTRSRKPACAGTKKNLTCRGVASLCTTIAL